MKPMNAIPIRPTMINAIPRPLSGSGMFEYASYSLIAAWETIARNQPIPEPRPNVVASAKVS